jgi:hypothetical protein
MIFPLMYIYRFVKHYSLCSLVTLDFTFNVIGFVSKYCIVHIKNWTASVFLVIGVN